MNILDICSWMPANELSLEKIEEIVLSLNSGKPNEEGYSLEMKLPINANENVISCSKNFSSKGRSICYLLINNEVIAVVGYKQNSYLEHKIMKTAKAALQLLIYTYN